MSPETIDVVGTEVCNNLFGDMNVEDIPIEIVDDLNDLTGHDDIRVTEVQGPPVCLFCPLSDEDHVLAAMKFSLVINPKSHPVRNFGVEKEMASLPTVTIRALGNGACLFNTFSLLLCGRDTYSAIIWHVICNYICNPVKHNFLALYFPTAYK